MSLVCWTCCWELVTPEFCAGGVSHEPGLYQRVDSCHMLLVGWSRYQPWVRAVALHGDHSLQYLVTGFLLITLVDGVIPSTVQVWLVSMPHQQDVLYPWSQHPFITVGFTIIDYSLFYQRLQATQLHQVRR